MTLKKKPFENSVGKGENAGNQHFLLFPGYFLSFPKQISIFLSHLFLSSANAFNLDQSTTLSFAKQLITYQNVFFFLFLIQKSTNFTLIKKEIVINALINSFPKEKFENFPT